MKLVLIAALAAVLWYLASLLGSSDTEGDGISSDYGGLPDNTSSPGRYGFADIARLWNSLGGDPSKASLAASVALAESGGDPNAYNGKDPHGGSFGLFQINGVHGNDASFDVTTNVKKAISLSNNGTNWNPWGAFTNGSYKDFFYGGS